MTTKYSSIGIFCKPNLPVSTLLYTVDTILSTIYSIGANCSVYVETKTAQCVLTDRETDLYKNIIVGTFDEIKNSVDLAIAIGGDGTLLGLARQFAQYKAHIIGINQGRLGFTTDLDETDIKNELGSLLLHGGNVEERDMISVAVMRRSVTEKDKVFFSGLALNDAVVNRAAISNMVELDVWVENSFLHSMRGDGLVICTPTGSTAYALSVNGPIIHPKLSCFGLVPIASQALSSRPISIPADMEITVVIKNGPGTVLHCDMQTVTELQDGDRLVVRKSIHKAKMLHPKTYDYFALLRKKLRWNINPGRIRNNSSSQ
ncbi:NAD(+)/NADH kinase [Betaproteobacteria bacterium]|nr:NAD(+)/NADH kinase [Betaproteobacteria bacterium]